MQIETINYSRTVNLGDYQSEKLEMTASVESYDDPNEAAKKLKHLVHFALGLTKNKPAYVKVEEIAEVVEGGNLKKTDGEVVETTPETEVVPEKPKKKAAKKKTTKKKVVKKVEAEVVEEKVYELPEVKVYELPEVQAALKNLAKTKGLPVGKSVLKDFGVEASRDLKPEQFNDVMISVAKCLK